MDEEEVKKSYIVICIFLLLMMLGSMFVSKCHSQGTCASPDGTDKETFIAPPNWQWLSDNGYCFTGTPMPSKNIAMCFTLTSPGTDIDFNAGITTTNCGSSGTNYVRLYLTSDCSLIDGTAIGTTTGLTVGTNYTWCISLSGNGGPTCVITSLCPYYKNVTVLPVELLSFRCVYKGDATNLEWIACSENNVNYYEIECSNDFIVWNNCYIMLAGNNSNIHTYTIIEIENYEYYRLSRIDYNGLSEILKVINCENNQIDISEAIWDVYTLSGQLMLHGVSESSISTLIESSGVYFLVNNKTRESKIKTIFR